ncbi:tandem-95 repeat protein, partial [Marinomonas communis]|uniref:tandem-95 repeat protein n=1 Tax=Marinomonas communis TaxID=28254 RepID=UPI0013C30C68
DLASGESRAVTFTYTATDNNGAVSAPKTVTITITGANDAPVVVNDTANAIEDGGAITINVLANDSDLEGDSLSVVGASVSADAGTVLIVGETIEFTPKAGFSGLTTITYTVSDGTDSSDGNVTVFVTEPNDAPVASDDTTQTTDENAILNGNVPVATDVDGTVESYQVVTSVLEGSLTFNTNGSYSFNPGSDFDDLDAGESRVATFTYTATDNYGAVSDPKTVTITVTGTNDAPVARDDATQNTGENTVLSSSVPVATDVDGTIASYQMVSTVAEGSLTFNSDGTYSFDPGSDFDDLAAGATRAVTFTYTATDNNGAVSNPQTVTITVTGTDDAPVASDDAQSTGENTVLSSSVPVATDVDGTIASYQMVTTVAEGSLTFNPDGTYSFDPGSDFDDLAAGATRAVTFTYTATDNNGAVSNPQTVTITVTGTDDAPVASDDAQSTGENTVLSSSVPVATDVDGTIASYQMVSTVSEGSLTFNPDGTYSFDPGSDFDDLAAGATRTVTFTYTATDNNGAVSEPSTVTITVTGTDDAPVASDDAQSTGENAVLSSSVPVATDVDGAIASYQMVSTVSEGSLTFNPDGTYSFDPGSDFD